MAVRPVAFYTVSDARHFLGLVALLNSLRLTGHQEHLVVADCGLEAWQRELLSPHAEVVHVHARVAPHLLKGVAPLERPASAMALLDVDLIVLRPLTSLIDTAARGRVVAFADPVSHRFDPSWESLLGLPPLRRQPYVNSGLVLLPEDRATLVLEALAAGQSRVDDTRTLVGAGRPSDPFYYLDQDILNAVLGSLVPPEALEIVDGALAPHPPFARLARRGPDGLRCVYAEGSEPFVLHHIGRKPWLASTRANLYTEFMAELLLGQDLPLRLEPSRVPPRFRAGALSVLARLRAEAAAIAFAQRGRLGLRRRLGTRHASS